MRISSPERLLREIALDPKVSAKHRTEALLAMDKPSIEFLKTLLRAGKKKLPPAVALTATALLKALKVTTKETKH